MSTISRHHADTIVKRKELKYFISYAQYISIANTLRKILNPDRHNKNGKGYFVRSLYFDTLDNKSFEEKMAGIENKIKYRLRVYDINTAWVKFEIKSKFNDSSVKEAALIRRKDAIEIQNQNYEVLYNNDPILKKAYRDFKKQHYRPVVVVEYEREAYTYDFNDIRIVFDKDLRATASNLDIFDKKSFLTSKIKKGLVVMEIKYNNFIPRFIKKILQIPSFERSAISKYCIGRLDVYDGIL